jgi:hypothetical protein
MQRVKFCLLWTFLSYLLFSESGFAQIGMLMPNPWSEVAATLPKGRFMVSFVNLQAPLESRYSLAGERTQIRSQLDRTIGWSEVTTFDLQRKSELEGLLLSHGVNPADQAAQFVGDFKGRVTGFIPLVGVGLTERIGLFAAFPIVRIQMESRIAFRSTPSSEKLIQELQARGMNSAAREFAVSLNNGFQDQITRMGYRFDESVDRTELGDVQLVMPLPFSLFPSNATPPLSTALQLGLLLPTGRLADVNDLYGIGLGGGSFVPSAKLVTEARATSWLSFSASMNISVPLPHSRSMRVPTGRVQSFQEELTPDIDPNVIVTQGVGFSAQLGSRLDLSRSFKMHLGIQHQLRGQNKFTGSRAELSPERYQVLGDISGMNLTSASASLELNTLQAFLDGDFWFPSGAEVAAALPLAGKNLLADPQLWLRASFFF